MCQSESSLAEFTKLHLVSYINLGYKDVFLSKKQRFLIAMFEYQRGEDIAIAHESRKALPI